MIYFTSDLHFGHDKEFIYKPRGFNSIEEHDETIINNWNSIVGVDDVVYVLGDIMLGDNTEGLKKLDKLNGNIRIISGNHDTDNRIKLYKRLFFNVNFLGFTDKNLFFNVSFLGFADRIKYKKYMFILSHYPTIVANKNEDKKIWNLHGHTHSKDIFSSIPHCYNISLDAHNNKPISIDKIIEDIKEFQNTKKEVVK